MKKLIAILLTALMMTGIACAYAEPVDGGWSVAENNALTDENISILNKALEGFVGADINPVAYLGSQVVAGTNHCFLCTSSPVIPNAGIHYVLVYVYEDLEGNAELLDIVDLHVDGEMDELPEEPVDGGWGFVTDHVVTDAHKELFSKATENLLGAEYEPVVYLSTQVVGGFNHCFLCKVTPVVPDAEAHMAIVYLYEGDETVEITDVQDVELGVSSETAAE